MILVRAVQIFIIALTMLVCYYWAPKIDGYINPVVINTKIESMKTNIHQSITTTEIEGSLDKVRDCDFLSFEFYVGAFPNSYSSVRADDLQATIEVVRPRSDVHFGPYRIYAPVDMLRVHSFVVITHNCYSGFLWNTETIIRADSLINEYEIARGMISVLPESPGHE